MSSRRYLFIDDHHISRIVGLRRTMHQVEKHSANPILKPDQPWEGEGIWVRHGAIYDPRDRLFKMWYNTNDHGGYGCYATSTDGIHWEKPNLDLVAFDGSRKNNIIESQGRVWQVVHDDAPPGPFPAGHTHLAMSWTPAQGQYVQTSADGLRWNSNIPPRIHAGDAVTIVKADTDFTGPDAADLPGYPSWPGRPRYVACARWCVPVGSFDGTSELRPARRILMRYVSDDFVNWEDPLRILTPDDLDDQMARERIEAALADGSLATSCQEDWRCELYDMLIVPYEDLYIGLLSVFDLSYEFKREGGNNQSGPMEVQLAASRDLADWNRLGDRKPFIPRGSAGEFDWAMSVFVSTPIAKDGKIWFFYTGACETHAGRTYANDSRGATRDHYNMLRTKVASGELPALDSVGLATLRRDGFISLDAGPEPGYVLTKPFVMPRHSALHLNVDARGGEVRVALCQPDGTPYVGYELSDPLSGDLLDAVVNWPKSATDQSRSLDELYTHETAAEAGTAENNDYERCRMLAPGKRVRLKIMAQHAKLYSYWLTSD